MRIALTVILGLTMLAGVASADHAVPWALSQAAWAEDLAQRYGADPQGLAEGGLQQATDAADAAKAAAAGSAESLAAAAQRDATAAAQQALDTFWSHENLVEVAAREAWAGVGAGLCCLTGGALEAFYALEAVAWAEKAEAEYPLTYALEGAPAQLDAALHGGSADPFYACGPFWAYANGHLPPMPEVPAPALPAEGPWTDVAWSC